MEILEGGKCQTPYWDLQRDGGRVWVQFCVACDFLSSNFNSKLLESLKV